MTQLLSLSRHTNNPIATLLDMPMHYFISIGNILNKQFKEEADKQKKDEEEARSHYSIPNMSNMPNLASLGSNLSSIPNISNFMR